MIHVVLTGGIASGKSTVATIFESLGAPIIDADIAARQVVAPGSDGLRQVINHFGDEILDEKGTLNRKALRERIFAKPRQRLALEQILHPLIAQSMIEQAANLSTPYLIFVIPLLTSRKSNYPIDRILVVDAPEQLQIERVMLRDQITEEQARNILEAQPTRKERLRLADDIILNLERASLQGTVEQLHQQYLQLAKQQC